MSSRGVSALRAVEPDALPDDLREHLASQRHRDYTTVDLPKALAMEAWNGIVVTVPFLQPFFQVAPVSFAWEWWMITLLALMPVTVIELTKLVRAGIARGRSSEGSSGLQRGVPHERAHRI